MPMFIRFLWIICLMLGTVHSHASAIHDHFLGAAPECVSDNQPVILVTDVSRSGEIDDTISLAMFHRLETIGCLRILAVVSVFGNGGSTTNQAHANLRVRLGELGIDTWKVLHGPDQRMSFAHEPHLSTGDRRHLGKIADVINASDRQVTMVELGPMTVSASLLCYGLVETAKIRKIVGIGGRAPGEHFKTGRGFAAFAFRDMNVAEDRASMAWLLRHNASRLVMTTYRTGIGERRLSPDLIESFGVESITRHAQKRARVMRFLGYQGIPSWDTWTAALFVRGGAERLGCRDTPARMRHAAEGFKPTDSYQLQFPGVADKYSRTITACHQTGR